MSQDSYFSHWRINPLDLATANASNLHEWANAILYNALLQMDREAHSQGRPPCTAYVQKDDDLVRLLLGAIPGSRLYAAEVSLNPRIGPESGLVLTVPAELSQLRSLNSY